MPIEFPKRIEKIDLTGSILTLSADPEEELVVQDILLLGGGDDEYATINNGGVNLYNRFYDDGRATFGGINGIDVSNLYFDTWLRKMYDIIPSIFISPGKDLTITPSNAAGTAYIVYAQMIGNDIRNPRDLGGYKSDSQFFISQSNTTQSIGIGATIDVPLVTAQNPSGLTKFPWEIEAPSNFEFDWLGFCIAKGSGNHANIGFNGLQVFLEDQSILAKDQALVDYELFPYPLDDGQWRPYLFNAPIKIVQGQILKTLVNVTSTDGGAQDANVLCSHLFLKRRVG